MAYAGQLCKHPTRNRRAWQGCGGSAEPQEAPDARQIAQADDPVTRPEGFDRLAAAMRSGGALTADVAFADCVDNSLAEQVVTEGVG